MRIHRMIAYSAVGGPMALFALGASAQGIDREFTWQDERLIVPEACLDEERRLIQLTPENTPLCSDLSSETVEEFNSALSDDDPANDPVAVIDDDGDDGAPETTGSVQPNSGAGNDGETGLTETGGDDEDPGNSGANNNAPSDPPGQVQ